MTDTADPTTPRTLPPPPDGDRLAAAAVRAIAQRRRSTILTVAFVVLSTANVLGLAAGGLALWQQHVDRDRDARRARAGGQVIADVYASLNDNARILHHLAGEPPPPTLTPPAAFDLPRQTTTTSTSTTVRRSSSPSTAEASPPPPTPPRSSPPTSSTPPSSASTVPAPLLPTVPPLTIPPLPLVPGRRRAVATAHTVASAAASAAAVVFVVMARRPRPAHRAHPAGRTPGPALAVDARNRAWRSLLQGAAVLAAVTVIDAVVAWSTGEPFDARLVVGTAVAAALTPIAAVLHRLVLDPSSLPSAAPPGD